MVINRDVHFFNSDMHLIISDDLKEAAIISEVVKMAVEAAKGASEHQGYQGLTIQLSVIPLPFPQEKQGRLIQ